MFRNSFFSEWTFKLLPRVYRSLSFILFLAAFSVLFINKTYSQIDREFWFVGPEASENHGDRPVYIRISTLDEPSNITLRMPANNKFVPVKNLIPANNTFSIRVDNIAGDPSWLDSIENRPADIALRKGFLLTSDKYITAYYEINNTSNPAIFPFKGRNSLGTEFYIPGQNNYANQVNNGSEAFDIVATRDTTTITITPAIDIVGHPANVPFQIVLNRGETFSARTLLTAASYTLAGSHIVSDKPIAITISDDSIITGGWDIIGDQIVPVNLLGQEYIAIKGYADNSPPNNNDERVYILAIQDGTEIRIDGNAVPAATLNAGAQYNYDIAQNMNTALIRANHPIYVYHLTGHPGEAGSSILPHDSCTGSQKVGFNRSSTSAFAMMILTRAGNEGSFQLNGSNSIITAPEFFPVPGTNGNWMYFRQNNMTVTDVPVGGNLLENSNGKFHLGILNNVGASSEYGYYSDFSTLYLGADANMCPGDSVVLDAGPYRDTYEWKRLVAGIWQTVGANQTYICRDTGYFACMTDGDFCTLYDTIKVMYYPNASVSLGSDRTICEGTTVTLSPGNYQSYEWSDGSNSPMFTTGNEGTVWVRVTNVNGCVARDTVLISVDSLPFANQVITGPTPVCQGQLQQAYFIPPLKYATSYEWQIPPGATGTSAINQILVDFIISAVSGQMTVRGSNNCGPGPNIIMAVTVNPLPAAPGIIVSPAQVCQGQSSIALSVSPVLHAIGYQWGLPTGFTMAGPPGSSITVNAGSSAQPGTITVYGTNGCGNGPTATTNIQVAILPVQPSAIQGPATVCQGQNNVIFSVLPLAGADSYIWSLPSGCQITSGAGTPAITVIIDSTAVSGIVTVKGHSNQCGDGPSSAMPLTINSLPSPAGTISGNNPVCQGQSGVVYSITPLTNATSYSWELPPGVLLLGGAGTPVVTVSITTTATIGLLRVQGTNSTCGAGRKSSLLLTVNPLPIDPGFISGPGSACQGDQQTPFSINPGDPSTSQYLWTLLPATAGSVVGNQTGITVNWSGAFTGQVFLQVKGTNGCGDGPLSPALGITVNYKPMVTYNPCIPLFTNKNARPVELKGGWPSGNNGEYSGTGVIQSGDGTWYFQPASGSITGSVSGTPYTIKYQYKNIYQCVAEATQIIRVYPSNSNDACPGNVTDVRDGKIYPTFMAGFGANAKCWMADNLDFGTFISIQTPQTDNCVAEKYCRNDLAQQCLQSGGFYQWRELMGYRSDAGGQGICMPGWHVPTETEWQTMINAVAAGISIPVDGIAGGFMKDSSLVNGFHAQTEGLVYLNKNWWFTTDPLSGVFFWTSTLQDAQHIESRGLTNKNPSVSRYAGSPANAFNLRCIKD